MPRYEENPKAGGFIFLGLAAIAGYWAYTKGWFSTPVAVTTSTQPASTSTTNPVNNGAAIVNAPTAPPPLGTVVSTAADLAAQVAAAYPYILPAQTIPSLRSLTPNGYSAIITGDYGTIFLRNDVYAVSAASLENRIKRAIDAGADATSVQASTLLNLAEIQNQMSINSLSGLAGLAAFGGGW